jgi:hypothetical protein
LKNPIWQCGTGNLAGVLHGLIARAKLLQQADSAGPLHPTKVGSKPVPYTYLNAAHVIQCATAGTASHSRPFTRKSTKLAYASRAATIRIFIAVTP